MNNKNLNEPENGDQHNLDRDNLPPIQDPKQPTKSADIEDPELNEEELDQVSAGVNRIFVLSPIPRYK